MSYRGTFPKSKLAPLCRKIGSGATPRGGKDTYLDSGPCSLIRSQNVYNHRFTTEGLAFISAEQADDLSNVDVQSGDVLLNITGDSVARCCQAPDNVVPARVNQHVAIIRPDSTQLDPTFLRYFLVSPQMQEQMLMLAGAGATRPALTKGMIEDFDVPKPDIDQQRAIANVLGTLDDKIELNRQMNETLEALAQTLFKNWFVDACLCDARRQAAATKLPKGWRQLPLPEAIEVNPPRSLRKGEVAPYLDMANMPTNSARALKVIDREFGSGMRFMDGDTLVARITPCLENGKTCFVDFLGDGRIGWGSTEYIVLRPKSPLPEEFAYFLARTESFRSFAISNMTGTTGRQRVPADCLRNLSIVIPPPECAREFGAFAKAVFAQMKSHDEESRTLAELRDALLPKLLSGELRVPRASA